MRYAPLFTLLVGLCVLSLVVRIPLAHAQVTTITVTTSSEGANASDGECSLREAITAANTNTAVDTCPAGQPAPAQDVITFKITEPRPLILLLSSLPIITEPVKIDGTTQGCPSKRCIELRGNRSSPGLVITGGSSVVTGLVLNKFNVAIWLLTNGFNFIQGNFIGTGLLGLEAVGNSAGGVLVESNNDACTTPFLYHQPPR